MSSGEDYKRNLPFKDITFNWRGGGQHEEYSGLSWQQRAEPQPCIGMWTQGPIIEAPGGKRGRTFGVSGYRSQATYVQETVVRRVVHTGQRRVVHLTKECRLDSLMSISGKARSPWISVPSPLFFRTETNHTVQQSCSHQLPQMPQHPDSRLGTPNNSAMRRSRYLPFHLGASAAR